jgi:septal ring-binding cell division protein DamX
MALEQLPMLPGQTTLVERVRYQLAVGTPFLFLTGDSGSGKTVLCEKICSAVENDYLCAFVPCSEVPSLLKLRELLLQQLSPTTVFNAEDKLLGTVQRINFNTSKVVIVVDNIDKAPDSFLIELAEIYQTYKSQELFNIILTSATSWADARVRSLKEIGITPIEIEIPYLNNQDKLNELEYYLRQYGVKVSDRDLVNIPEIEKKCSPEDVRKLAQKLTDKNKESAMNNDTKSVEKKVKNKVEKETAKVNKTSKVSLILTMCALVIAVGVLGFVWYKQSNTNIVFSKNVPDNSLKQTPPSQLNQEFEEQKTENEESENDSFISDLPDTVEENPVVVAETTEEPKNEIVVPDEELTEIENTVATDEKKSLSSKMDDTDVNKLVNDSVSIDKTTQKAENSSKSQNEANKVSDNSADKASVKSESDTVVAPAVNEESSASKDNAKEEKVDNVSVKKDVLPETTEKAEVQQDNIKNDFQSLDNKHYSVQLMATKSKADAQSFASKLEGNSWVLFRNKDKNYIVMWGDFESSQMATTAIKTLPKNVRNQGPWAKKIGKVKQEIN